MLGTEIEALGSSKPSAAEQYLTELTTDQINDLIGAYQNMVGFMFPIIDTGHLSQLVDSSALLTTAGNKLVLSAENDAAVLRMVIAIALSGEHEIHDNVAVGIYESLKQQVYSMVWNTRLDLNGLTLIVLVVSIHPHEITGSLNLMK